MPSFFYAIAMFTDILLLHQELMNHSIYPFSSRSTYGNNKGSEQRVSKELTLIRLLVRGKVRPTSNLALWTYPDSNGGPHRCQRCTLTN